MLCVASKMVNWISRLTSASSTLPRACHLLITNIVHDSFVSFIAFTTKPTGCFNGWVSSSPRKTSLSSLVTTCNLNLLYSALYVCVSTAGFLWPGMCPSSSSWVKYLEPPAASELQSAHQLLSSCYCCLILRPETTWYVTFHIKTRFYSVSTLMQHWFRGTVLVILPKLLTIQG